MSGKPCKETYCNYGSYLSSRGYDKAICDLIAMIENGEIPIGPFQPNGKCNAKVVGTLETVECPDVPNGPGNGSPDNGTGQIWASGGYAGEAGAAAHYLDLSVQAMHGSNTVGPLIQKAPTHFMPNNHYNRVHIPGNVNDVIDSNYLEYNTIFGGNVNAEYLYFVAK